MKNLFIRRFLSFILCLALFSGLIFIPSCSVNNPLDPNNPITIKIWHYYNGSQLVAFDDMLKEFNDTDGKKIGVYAIAESQGSVNDLATKVIAYVNGETGAAGLPDIFGSYPDTAYIADSHGLVASYDTYMTASEFSEYKDSFVAEGDINANGEHKIFPIAKSTEVLLIDNNIWMEFLSGISGKSEYGTVTNANLSTWEGISAAAQAYYKWTDSQTADIKNDGKAMFGIDSIANFIYIGAKQLGVDLVKIKNGQPEYNLDKNILKKMWDIYYGNMVRGYFAAIGRFRSDDVKTGSIIGYVGASTGSSYFPAEITFSDGKTKPVDLLPLSMPYFKDGKKVAIQQGAGMVISKSDEAHEYASVQFLKWFTSVERNIGFASSSSYLPVKNKSLNGDEMKAKIAEFKIGTVLEKNVGSVFEVALSQLVDYTLYYSDPYDRSYDFRKMLESEIVTYVTPSIKAYSEALKAGKTIEQAYADLKTDELFEQWYKSLSDFSVVE